MAKKSTKKNLNKIKKKIKKFSKPTIIIAIICFLIAFAGGVFTTYYLTKNDTFELIGDSYIELEIGEEYIEYGAKIIAFNKDISNEVIIKGTVDTSNQGEYILKYTVDNFRFKGYTLYKKIVVGEVTNG